MQNFELIHKYRFQLEETKKHWEKLKMTKLEGFKNKYGPFEGFIPLQELGLFEVHENYLQETKILEEKIQFEINKSIAEFANEIAKLNINNKYLVDYRIPFRYFYNYNEILHYDFELTTVDKVQMFIMQCENELNLNNRINVLKKEQAFFTFKDAVVVSGKAEYQRTIKNAESNLKSINIFDKSGKITVIGKIIKNRFENYYRNNEDPVDKKYFFSLKGISLNKLIQFYFDFLNLDAFTKNEILESCNSDENSKVDLIVLEQFAIELQNRKK